MKKIFIYFIIFILLSTILLVLNSATAATQDIIINEIGSSEGADYEWVEIYNRGQNSIDLTGWKFVENFIDSNPDGTNHGLNFSGNASLVAGQYAVIAQDAIKLKEKYPSLSTVIIDSSWSSLNEGGEKIGLKDADGNFAELFTYISAINYSLERKDPNLNDYTATNWQEHPSTNTIGAQNSSKQNNNQTTTQQTIDSSQETTQTTTNQQESQTTENTISFSPTSNLQPPTPIVANAGENIIALIKQEITFDASKSQGASIYEWNFGDGSTTKEKVTKHKYNFPGKYIISLTISDGQNTSQSQITATIHPLGIYINEFIPSPAGSDENEWIEIYNSNDFPADISGWTISDNSKKSFSFPQNTFIAQRSYIVISRKTTGIALNNDIDVLKFSYPENILVEEIKYEKAKEGYSASRKQNNSFVWTKNPTPSSPNIISSENIGAQNTNTQKMSGQKLTIAILEQNKAQNITVSNQKFIVLNNGFIIKNLVNTAEAHHVEEEIIGEDNPDGKLTKSESENDSPAQADHAYRQAGLSANINNAVNLIKNTGSAIKIIFILAIAGSIALMWRVIKKK